MAGTGPATSGYPRIGGVQWGAGARLWWDSQKNGVARYFLDPVLPHL